MKLFIFLLTLLASFHSFAGISGRVSSVEGCAKKVMVWLSLDRDNYQERKLLLHTEVPVGGSYKFYAKPGKYQVRASDEVGCEFFTRVEVKDSDLVLNIGMVKK